MKNIVTLITLFLLFLVTPALAQLSRLRADGPRIVNAQGQEVILKGVGLGGWLLQEGYMIKPSFSGGGTQWSIKKRLYDQGQSIPAVAAFYQQWRNNFITRADIDFIASLGFNCIRLPMHYDLFLSDAQRAMRDSVAQNGNLYDQYVSRLTQWYNSNQLFNDTRLEGFRLIDSTLRWAAANRLYVILDLHAAPGAQGTDANIADIFSGNDLWNKAIYRDITVRLWQRLSTRYKDQDAIAFYDLINEPNNVPDNRSIHDLFERLINAVREQGDNHLLMIEGNGWGNNYNYMEPFTFSNRSNLVYNAHRYWITNSTTTTDPDPNQINQIANMVNFRNTHQVPVWVGETGENNNTWLQENIQALNSKGIGWCHWTYKRFDGQENAALLRISPPYLMDGAGNMSAVLNNIRFAANVRNNGTIAAVAPGSQQPGNAPIGAIITLKGFNNTYVSGENGEKPMICNRPAPAAWEQFTVVDAGGGKIALRSQGKYVSSENGQQAITCNRPSIQDWEKFDWLTNADGTIALRGNNGRYISCENGTNPMTCNRTSSSGWEAFTWARVNAATAAAAVPPATTFKVVGYMPSWSGSVSQIQYSKLTHINYAFLLPTPTGGLRAIENPSKLQSLVTNAHNNNVKVLIAVGGWNNGNDSDFESLAANSTYRTSFVNNMVNFVNQYNLDGVDIDWEYPDAGASANNYVALMTQLATAMHTRGKLLTAAVIGENGGSILSSVFAQVDFLNLMAYDYNNFDHATYNYATQSINYWKGRGLPVEKTVLGVPFYGRPSWESFAQLVARGANPYADVFSNVGYNGISTIKQKTNLAFDQGGGIMMWELSQDATGANSLLSAIHEVVLQRTGTPGGTAPIGKTIWLRGNNSLYVNPNGGNAMWCNSSSTPGFLVVDAGGGKIALRNNGLYVSSENGQQALICNRAAIQDWEKFTWVTNSNGTVSLRGNNNQYISSENGVKAMFCNRPAIDGWEMFNYGETTAKAAVTGTGDAAMSATGDKPVTVTVYPNPAPAGSTLNVQLSSYDSKSPLQVSIVDGNRKVVAAKSSSSRQVQVSTAQLPAGMYIIIISNGAQQYTRKILIQ